MCEIPVFHTNREWYRMGEYKRCGRRDDVRNGVLGGEGEAVGAVGGEEGAEFGAMVEKRIGRSRQDGRRENEVIGRTGAEGADFGAWSGEAECRVDWNFGTIARDRCENGGAAGHTSNGSFGGKGRGTRKTLV